MPVAVPRAQRRLLHEMARDQRVILVQKHPRRLMWIQYTLNSFPARHVRGTIVANLARRGYLALSPRGYYVVTIKGQLLASKYEERKRS